MQFLNKIWLGSLFAFFLALGCLSSSAFAESQTPQDLTDLGLEDLMNIQITTASKAPRAAREAPASVTVITKDDIKRFGYRTLSEALRGVIGFYGTNDHNYEYLGVRGIARPGDYNTRILLLVDGHKINDPNYDYAPVGEDLGVDINSLERIEIIKGASSAVWGTNGLLSVINLITKKGKDIKGGSASIDYGSHDRTKGFVEYGTQTQDGFDIYSSISALDSKGQSSIYFPEYDQVENNNGTTTNNDEEAAYRGLIKASYEGANLLLTRGWRRKEVPTASYGTLFSPSGNKTWDYSTRADLSYERKVSSESNSSVFVRTFYDNTGYYANYKYSDSEDPDIITTNRDEGSSRLFGGEMRYSGNIFPSLSLVAGVEAQRAYDLHFGYGELKPEPNTSLNLNDGFSLFSGFSELDYELLTNLHLIAGLRIDHYSAQNSHWSPRGGVVYTPIENTTLKLLYGGAFRQANNYERQYADNVYYLGNNNLDPEEMESYELILEQQISKTTLSMDLFRFDLKNIISQTALPSGFLQFQNGGTIHSEGVEFRVNSRFDGGYLASGGFSITRATDIYSGSVLTNSPRYLGNIALSIPMQGELFILSPELQWIGPRNTLQGNSLSNSYLTNCRLLSEKLIKDFALSLSVYNLFNQKIYSPGAEEHIQDKMPQDGRTWMVEVQRKF